MSTDPDGSPRLPLTWFDVLAGIIVPVICFVADYLLERPIVRFAPIGLQSFAVVGMTSFLFSGKAGLARPVRDLILGTIIGASFVLLSLAVLLLPLAYVMFRVAVNAIFDDTSSTPIPMILGMLGVAVLGLSPILTTSVYIRRALNLMAIDRHRSWLLISLGAAVILFVPIVMQMGETSWIRIQLTKLQSIDANAQLEALQKLNAYPLRPVWLNGAVCSLARPRPDDDPIQQELQRMLGPDPVRTCNDRAAD